MLSAVVLTKNEGKNILECLKSLDFCDEIIIVDDYSTDNTMPEIQNYNAKLKIFQRRLKGDFAAQRNFGLEKAKGDWILFIDADERVSSVLAGEIKSSISERLGKSVNGFYFKRKDKFLGKWLSHGETAKVKLLRLAKKNAGKWKGKVHEMWQIKGKRGEFKNPLLHERKLTIAQFLARINSYSTTRSEELYESGERVNIVLITLYPLLKFTQNYFFRLGFLDGIPGLIMAGMMSLHSFMVRAKLWVRQNNQGEEEFKVVSWKRYA